MAKRSGAQLGPKEREELLRALKARFEGHVHRHPGVRWADVQARLERRPEKLWSLGEMERTGGEPDVIGQGRDAGEYLFVDCSAQSPKGRRSLCYDRQALERRKEHKPLSSALDMAAAMGAIFGDRRYGAVFVYHNGAESYYAARGFRCALRV